MQKEVVLGKLGEARVKLGEIGSRTKTLKNNWEFEDPGMVVMQKVLVSVLYKMTFQVRNQASAKVFFRVR